MLQDVLTLHGSQFRSHAHCRLAACQAYSYRAMPWKRAKALPPPDNSLFEACFRIQREACAAAGRYIPMVVENVRGAEKWVGSAAWHFGSYYLWGDVPALMPPAKAFKIPGFRFDGSGGSFQTASVNFGTAANLRSEKGNLQGADAIAQSPNGAGRRSGASVDSLSPYKINGQVEIESFGEGSSDGIKR